MRCCGGRADRHLATTGGDGIAFASRPGAGGNGPVVVQADRRLRSRSLITFTAGTPAARDEAGQHPREPRPPPASAAPVPFAVQLFAADGVTPAAGEPVTCSP